MVGEGYFLVPGLLPNRNVHGNTYSSMGPLVNVDNILKNENDYNGALLLQSQDQHLLHSNESLQPTMLKQEAIFNDQDLCDYYQKGSHAFSMPRVNPVVNQFPVSTAENDPSCSHLNEGNFKQSAPDPGQTAFSSRYCELESSKKFGRKVFDLERPATEYIDSEDEEPSQKVPEVSDSPLNRISESVRKSDWQPFVGSGGVNLLFHEDKPSLASVSSRRFLFADLNEPIKLEEMSGTASIYLPDLNDPHRNEEEVASASKFLVDLNEPPFELQEEAALPGVVHSPLAGHVDFSCQDLAQNCYPCSQLRSTDITQNTRTDKDSETCSNHLHLETSDVAKGQRGCDVTSLSPDFSEEASVSLKNIDLKQAHEYETSHLANLRKRKSCSEAFQNLGKDLSSRSNLVTVSTNHLGTSSQPISLSDLGSSKPSSVSSSMKHVHNIVRIPVIVQALPCVNSPLRLRTRFKSPVVPGSDVADKRFRHLKSSRYSPNFESGSFSKSSISNGSSSESKTLESHPPSIGSNGLNVSEENDLAIEPQGPLNFSRLCEEVKAAEHINSTSILPSSSLDGERKLEDSLRGLAWPKIMCGHKRKRVRRSNSSTKVETCQNPSEDEDIEKGANDRVRRVNVDGDYVPEAEKLTSPKLVVECGLDKKMNFSGDGIDLTIGMGDDKFSPTPPLSTELGLDGPVSPENKERSPPRGDSDENQVETSEISGNEDGDAQEDLAQNSSEAMMSGEENRDLHEEFSRNAATALVSISSCKPSEPSRSDVLDWFAKVVSLVACPDSDLEEVLSSEKNGDHEEQMLNELDYFEAMTLSLNETKVEADWFKTNGQEQEKENTSADTYLPNQQRRGRTRRARQQQKDFQIEILPSLASLSRCKVTEDPQIIEGRIEAANSSQRGIVCTRSGSRNARARGRKRSSIRIPNPTDFTVCSTSKQHPSFVKKYVEEREPIDWGRTTRRSRGPRSHATNPWLR